MPLARAIPFDWRYGLVVLGLLACLPVAWYLGSPLFVSRSVSEALPGPTAPSAAATTPALIAKGSFGVVDRVHHGQGSASVLKLPDGTRMLRFEDFAVTNGPDLYVYLSAHPAPRSSAQLHDGDAYEVAALKGNVGDQNYALPADLNLDGFRSAVIYCRRFGVVFSSAQLTREGTDQ
jgi:hypothetical protein